MAVGFDKAGLFIKYLTIVHKLCNKNMYLLKVVMFAY